MQKYKRTKFTSAWFKVFLLLIVFSSRAKPSVNILNGTEEGKIKNLEIEYAYRMLNGQVIVCFKNKENSNEEVLNNPSVVNKNACFYGNENGFFQLKGAGYSGNLDKHLQEFAVLGEHGYAAQIVSLDFKDGGVFLLNCNNKENFSKVFDFSVTLLNSREELSSQLKTKKLNEDSIYKNNLALLGEDELLSLTKKIQRKSIPLWSLPDYRIPELMFKDSENEFYYISANALDYNYESFLFYKGKANSMKELKISDFMRYKDGGTTFIEIADTSLLYYPSPRATEKQASYKRADGKVIPLEKIETTNLNIDFLGLDREETLGPKSIIFRNPCEKISSFNH